MYDFDTPVSRVGTHAEKYTSLGRLYGREDIMPFWVADMEFGVASAIQEALARRVDHPVYGYTSIQESLIDAITQWNQRRYGLVLDNESVSLIPGVMSGVSAALFALSKPGDAVVVQTPLYPPIMSTVKRNDRQLVENQLIIDNDRYCIDFDKLEHLFQIHKPKIFILCSPHNPVGRVWKRNELERLGHLLRLHDTYLVSDEIHADIVFEPHKHVSALSLDNIGKNRIIVLNAASKSFNIAGLNTAYAIIPDLRLRSLFRKQLRCMNFHGVNLFGMVALEAAYSEGEKWLDELLAYLQANQQYMGKKLYAELPELQHFEPEGTYLYWLNFNALGLRVEEIKEKLINVARVGLNDGATFSRTTEGFWRFNFGVPRSMLKEGLESIVEAFR